MFERVINPGYALFATVDNVQECSNVEVSVSEGESLIEGGVEESYNDPQLRELLQNARFEKSAPVSRQDILDFLRTELELFVPSEKNVLLSQVLTESGEHDVSLKINSNHRENLRVVVS